MRGADTRRMLTLSLPLVFFLHTDSNLTEFTSAPAPTLHHPPFGQTPREARYLSSSTRSEAVRVQRAEGSEGGPAGSPPPLSPALELNCPLEKMKVSVASLFLLILILATTSALRGQESE